jgi:hypothetical protein
VKIVELSIAAMLVIGGLRSSWRWSKRRFESPKLSDQILYGLYLTGRIGLWFAFAGFFLIYAALEGPKVGAVNELDKVRWYVMVPLVLSAVQLLCGYALGRRSSDPMSR